MSRPARLLFPVTIFAASVALSGCGTIYSDMYSPKRSRFVPTKEAPVVSPSVLPPDVTEPVAPPMGGALPPPPAPPVSDPLSMPADPIPGL